jgi:hypothetical protein
MDATGNSVEAFFREYEQGALVTCFASTFLYAGPEGAQAMDLGVFTQALPRRRELFDRAGHRSTRLVSVDAKAISAAYTLAETEWSFQFDHTEITNRASFLLHNTGNGWKIVLYLPHQDIVSLMRDRGLLHNAT